MGWGDVIIHMQFVDKGVGMVYRSHHFFQNIWQVTTSNDHMTTLQKFFARICFMVVYYHITMGNILYFIIFCNISNNPCSIFFLNVGFIRSPMFSYKLAMWDLCMSMPLVFEIKCFTFLGGSPPVPLSPIDMQILDIMGEDNPSFNGVGDLKAQKPRPKMVKPPMKQISL